MYVRLVVYLLLSALPTYLVLRFFAQRRFRAALWLFAIGGTLGVLLWGTLLVLALAGIPVQATSSTQFVFLCMTAFAGFVAVYSAKHRNG